MLKNIKWGDLAYSKTFWGAVLAVVGEAAKVLLPAYAAVIIQVLGFLLAAVGLVDRTATPNAGK